MQNIPHICEPTRGSGQCREGGIGRPWFTSVALPDLRWLMTWLAVTTLGYLTVFTSELPSGQGVKGKMVGGLLGLKWSFPPQTLGSI